MTNVLQFFYELSLKYPDNIFVPFPDGIRLSSQQKPSTVMWIINYFSNTDADFSIVINHFKFNNFCYFFAFEDYDPENLSIYDSNYDFEKKYCSKWFNCDHSRCGTVREIVIRNSKKNTYDKMLFLDYSFFFNLDLNGIRFYLDNNYGDLINHLLYQERYLDWEKIMNSQGIENFLLFYFEELVPIHNIYINLKVLVKMIFVSNKNTYFYYSKLSEIIATYKDDIADEDDITDKQHKNILIYSEYDYEDPSIKYIIENHSNLFKIIIFKISPARITENSRNKMKNISTRILDDSFIVTDQCVYWTMYFAIFSKEIDLLNLVCQRISAHQHRDIFLKYIYIASLFTDEENHSSIVSWIEQNFGFVIFDSDDYKFDDSGMISSLKIFFSYENSLINLAKNYRDKNSTINLSEILDMGCLKYMDAINDNFTVIKQLLILFIQKKIILKKETIMEYIITNLNVFDEQFNLFSFQENNNFNNILHQLLSLDDEFNYMLHQILTSNKNFDDKFDDKYMKIISSLFNYSNYNSFFPIYEKYYGTKIRLNNFFLQKIKPFLSWDIMSTSLAKINFLNERSDDEINYEILFALSCNVFEDNINMFNLISEGSFPFDMNQYIKNLISYTGKNSKNYILYMIDNCAPSFNLDEFTEGQILAATNLSKKILKKILR
jgi:hypothetical protein